MKCLRAVATAFSVCIVALGTGCSQDVRAPSLVESQVRIGWIRLVSRVDGTEQILVATTEGGAALRIGKDGTVPSPFAPYPKPTTVLIPVNRNRVRGAIDAARALTFLRHPGRTESNGTDIAQHEKYWHVEWRVGDEEGVLEVDLPEFGENRILCGLIEEVKIITNYYLSRSVAYGLRAEYFVTGNRTSAGDAVHRWSDACQSGLSWCEEQAIRTGLSYDPPLSRESLVSVQSEEDARRLEPVFKDAWLSLVRGVVTVIARDDYVVVRLTPGPTNHNGLTWGLPSTVDEACEKVLLDYLAIRCDGMVAPPP